jgi:hypothetical protein
VQRVTVHPASVTNHIITVGPHSDGPQLNKVLHVWPRTSLVLCSLILVLELVEALGQRGVHIWSSSSSRGGMRRKCGSSTAHTLTPTASIYDPSMVAQGVCSL